ncbi:MAG: 2,3-bisphosphoglycerate-independent phosphoglycerate mutase [Eubacterium sp.]|nr:2,3-bisphosphoglycerate-independent phosphoglycerate mutase [Eubacterium sp.]
MSKKTTMLMILDGFGVNPETYGNAIAQAKKPHLDELFAKYPGTTLKACGLAVGLPEGQMGNSEVGHLNIGAGRVIYQELTRITKAIEDGDFFDNPALISVMDGVKARGSKLHILGLLSDGGVHSHINHLEALLLMARTRGLNQVVLHCFLDGRDVPPRCAAQYFEAIDRCTARLGIGKVAVISGRYYAMDRDKRWERVIKAYDAMTLGEGRKAHGWSEALDLAYSNDEGDEFVLPTVVRADTADGSACADDLLVADGDGMIMFNFRPDRAREITRAFVDPDFDGFERRSFPKVDYVCMCQYDAEMPNVTVAYPPEKHKNTFGEYISRLGYTQLRIAETEKYAHVTFFFNGGVEEPNPGEDRILVPSPKVATYDLKPEMSAYEVTDQVLEAIAQDKYDFIILNFANADMVGHTGVMEAAVKAIEALDACVPRIVDAILQKDGQILLTADHGNADEMLDHDGNVVTSHSLNPVPLYHIAREPRKLADGGRLCDIMPTLLTLAGVEVPEEMTGRVLV